jgi:hypothetical protein
MTKTGTGASGTRTILPKQKIVSPLAWEAARQQLLVKEKARCGPMTPWRLNADACRG